MNVIDILSALDSLPEEYILEASTQKAPERPHRPSLLLVAVLAAVLAMLDGMRGLWNDRKPTIGASPMVGFQIISGSVFSERVLSLGRFSRYGSQFFLAAVHFS